MEFKPFEHIGDVVKFIYEGYRAWRGFRLLAFGTTRVGKSTLWAYLEKGKLVDASMIPKTEIETPIGGGKFRIRDIRLAGVKVAIRAVDVPGDQALRASWHKVLYEHKPHGIIFMIDNVEDTKTGVPPLGYNPDRLTEHYEAFKYIRDLILVNEEVMETLQAFLVLVNKNDSFPPKIGYGDVIAAARLDTLYSRFHEMPNVRMRAMPCSAQDRKSVV